MRAIASLRAVACAALVAAVALPADAVDAPREVHGVSDAFAVPGIALAWGVLRGADEAATVIALRIVADPARFSALAVSGTDPFTRSTVALLPSTPISGRIELRIPRAHFAEFPRTDLRFDAATSAPQNDAPGVIVYFLGVPDTTPEFASPTALDAYLADRIARAAATTAGKPP